MLLPNKISLKAAKWIGKDLQVIEANFTPLGVDISFRTNKVEK